ncbi:hypothetical protein BJY52DRAFT_1256330, partial [Lactarius psammicola]
MKQIEFAPGWVMGVVSLALFRGSIYATFNSSTLTIYYRVLGGCHRGCHSFFRDGCTYIELRTLSFGHSQLFRC